MEQQVASKATAMSLLQLLVRLDERTRLVLDDVDGFVVVLTQAWAVVVLHPLADPMTRPPVFVWEETQTAAGDEGWPRATSRLPLPHIQERHALRAREAGALSAARPPNCT